MRKTDAQRFEYLPQSFRASESWGKLSQGGGLSYTYLALLVNSLLRVMVRKKDLRTLAFQF